MTDNLQLAFAKYHEGDQAAADWLLRVVTVEVILDLAREMRAARSTPASPPPPPPAPAALSAADLDKLARKLHDLIRSDRQGQQAAIVDLLRFIFSKEDKES